jgi:transmembrane 9 superfamily protein 3
VLEGNELRNSGFKVHFGVDVEKEVVCDTELDAADAAHFKSAVDQQYWYELYLDDLPMWGMVGEILRDESSGQMVHHVFTHRSLSLTYNANRILEVNLTSEAPAPVDTNKKLRFTYSVHWRKSNKDFASRFDRYLESDFFEHQIHWFSIFNSFMMVVFLCGLVALILLRTLRNDFARYAKGDMDGDEAELGAGLRGLGEDSGWKQVHGDVFRAPEHLELFSAMVGTGWQLIVLILGVILWSIAGPVHGYMYEDRGKMASAFIVCFALSSAVSGYSSGSFYK